MAQQLHQPSQPRHSHYKYVCFLASRVCRYARSASVRVAMYARMWVCLASCLLCSTVCVLTLFELFYLSRSRWTLAVFLAHWAARMRVLFTCAALPLSRPCPHVHVCRSVSYNLPPVSSFYVALSIPSLPPSLLPSTVLERPAESIAEPSSSYRTGTGPFPDLGDPSRVFVIHKFQQQTQLPLGE